jgi:hypothetical protein
VAKRIEIQIIGDAESLSKAAKQGVGDLGHLGNATDSSGSKWAKFSAVAKAAAVGGIGALVVGLKGSVDAARDAQVSQTKMQTQLKALGISYKAHAGEIDNVIQKTSKLAGLDDEDLQDAFTAIVRTTGNVSKSLRLTGLAADFARAKHLDVAKAGEIVAKVAGGNTGILSRYGVTIHKGATATEALGALQQKFSGQAAAYGKTAAGAQDRFKVATENLQEAIGKGLLPVITKLANGIADLLDWMGKHKTVAIALVGVVGTLGGALVAMKAYTLGVAAATGIAEAAQWAYNAALVDNPIGLVVLAIAGLVAALVLAWQHSETFRAIVTGVFNAVKAEADFVFGAVKSVVLGAAGAAEAAWQTARTVLSSVWNGIKAAADAVWSAIKTAIVTPIHAAIDLAGNAADAIGHALSSAWNGIKGATGAAWDFIHDHILSPIRDARDAVGGVVDGIGNRVSSGWGAVKSAVSSIGSGIESALTAPFRAALGAIGDIVDKIKGLISSITSLPGKALHAVGLAQGGTVSGLASGGMVVRRVGELGPENVALPVGSRVTQASESFGGGGNVYIEHATITSASHGRVMANQLAHRLRFG